MIQAKPAEIRQPVVLYDGVCKLCNSAVSFLLRNDSKGIFRYAAIDSDFGKEVLQNSPAVDSVILYYQGRLYKKSDVTFKALSLLGGGWKILSVFSFVPRFLRDGVYDFIAKHRYSWFGKYQSCPVPQPEWEERFFS